MRLLHTTELYSENVLREDPEPYAVLSHTWDYLETTYQEMVGPNFKISPGYGKIKSCCDTIKKDHKWVWIDTCCIDKTSSAELGEAINSMYYWYQRATVCYVYLTDFEGHNVTLEKLRRCKWFTRGWTLQELLAPRKVIFWNSHWEEIGTKQSMANLISTITGIPLEVLQGKLPARDCNIAQRFSWAAKRNTTRSEDIAYCLLGLFDCQMSPIYGEGSTKAFFRLQEEILKRWNDQTIFLWTHAHDPRNNGLLATSPKPFCKHPECFSWLFDANWNQQNISEGFDPYKYLVPVAADILQVTIADKGVEYGIKPGHNPSRAGGFFLGPEGLQVSLLFSKDINAVKDTEIFRQYRQLICFDVLARKPMSPPNRVLLWLEYDPVTDSSSQNISRRGLLSRYPYVEGLEVPFWQYRLFPDQTTQFFRQTFPVSQQEPTEAYKDTAKFAFKELPASGRTVAVYYEPAGLQHLHGSRPRPISCDCATVRFDHEHPSCGGAPFQIAFGVHGRNKETWCHILSTHEGMNRTLCRRLVAQSTRFKNHCYMALDKSHDVRLTVYPNIDGDSPIDFDVCLYIIKRGLIDGPDVRS
ncbi:HET-domain-containing protein [Microthyrium microscopicum]|uniref:HET-domain-containing protein n=1 Tax=Microthyrium microscopicum TaxID=703497 RepID=A0A6A6U8Q4_9PEZI|nr:HET-domain-containing protein [Microthyrium microscopicum]